MKNRTQDILVVINVVIFLFSILLFTEVFQKHKESDNLYSFEWATYRYGEHRLNYERFIQISSVPENLQKLVVKNTTIPHTDMVLYYGEKNNLLYFSSKGTWHIKEVYKCE